MRSFAIIPAAGQSTRMGRSKLLLPWSGCTVIQCVLAAWRESGVCAVVTVVHPEDRALADCCRGAGSEVVVAKPPPREMKDSVCFGLDHLRRVHCPQEQDVWLMAPGDMPRLSSTLIQRLLSAHNPAAPAILVAARQGRRGHPVLFPWPFAGQVAGLGAEEGINAMLARNPVRQIECEDAAVLDDMDTPDDYRRLQHP